MAIVYVDNDGKYIGCFSDGYNLEGNKVAEHSTPTGGVAVPHAPVHASQVWDFDTQTWSEPTVEIGVQLGVEHG